MSSAQDQIAALNKRALDAVALADAGEQAAAAEEAAAAGDEAHAERVGAADKVAERPRRLRRRAAEREHAVA